MQRKATDVVCLDTVPFSAPCCLAHISQLSRVPHWRNEAQVSWWANLLPNKEEPEPFFFLVSKHPNKSPLSVFQATVTNEAQWIQVLILVHVRNTSSCPVPCQACPRRLSAPWAIGPLTPWGNEAALQITSLTKEDHSMGYGTWCRGRAFGGCTRLFCGIFRGENKGGVREELARFGK